MHQIFYIDIDEEITSIVDRLKKSKAGENYFVIPQRSYVLQSIVNLKLLKREAEKMKKRAILITQSDLGQALAQKAGIETRLTTDGLIEEKKREDNIEIIHKEQLPEEKVVRESIIEDHKIDKKIRLENLGSSDFFENKQKKNVENIEKPMRIVPKRVVKDEKDAILKSAVMNDMLPKSKNDIMPEKIKKEKTIADLDYDDHISYGNKGNTEKVEKLESLFRSSDSTTKQENKEKPIAIQKEIPIKSAVLISSRIKKILMIFCAVCFLVALLVAAYVLIPHAKISIYPKNETKEIDLDFTGDAKAGGGDFESKTVSAELIEKEINITKSFETTGKDGASGGQKSRGKVVIFNEYSKDPQVLVATTRLLSENGKIFRLTKNVTVPGMMSISGESKPGAIEADVVADGVGDEFNIGPSRFTIPGFEGGPKYEKYYAKSEKTMTGGDLSGSQSQVVSAQDLSDAKQETESEAKNQAVDELMKEAGNGYVIIDGSVDSAITESVPQAKAGDMKNIFDFQVKDKARAIKISEDQVKEIIIESLNGKYSDLSDKRVASLKIEYRQAANDFESQVVHFKVHASVIFVPELDLEKIKKDLLGKNEDGIREIIKNNQSVEQIEINITPKFFSSQIPPYSRQVEIGIAEGVDKK
jgi:hypothetical protein